MDRSNSRFESRGDKLEGSTKFDVSSLVKIFGVGGRIVSDRRVDCGEKLIMAAGKRALADSKATATLVAAARSVPPVGLWVRIELKVLAELTVEAELMEAELKVVAELMPPLPREQRRSRQTRCQASKSPART